MAEQQPTSVASVLESLAAPLGRSQSQPLNGAATPLSPAAWNFNPSQPQDSQILVHVAIPDDERTMPVKLGASFTDLTNRIREGIKNGRFLPRATSKSASESFRLQSDGNLALRVTNHLHSLTYNSDS